MKTRFALLLVVISVVVVGFTSSFSEQEYPLPLKQLQTGTSPDKITCNRDLVLVIKKSDESPACVKETTALRLLEIGWAKEILKQKPTQFSDTWIPQLSSVEESRQTGAAVPAPAIPQHQSGSYAMQASSPESMGFSVGGAKDVENFRENIENDYLPLPSDMTYEGLYYDYYFDTGKKQECEKLFCPSYSYAISKDPFSNEPQYYLSVGLNSGIKENDFERKKLNLVIVLDVSGSMSSQFTSYYYDQFGKRIQNPELTLEEKEDASKTKMRLASESLAGLVDHLNVDDNLGVVLFNNGAHLAKPLERIEITDVDRLKENILEITAGGGTNLDAGMKMGTSLFSEILDDYDPAEYENRIIFLTDAMPNMGDTSETGLLATLKNNSEKNIFTTFIGIGVDFNTELVELISKVKGANYYSIHSSSEFKSRMGEEFEFMVTPLVFDLVLSLESDQYKISEVYGSPEADTATGEIMNVSTLFPSKTEAGQTRGGIILLKLEKVSDSGDIKLKTTYKDRQGNSGGNEVIVQFDNSDEDYFENSGIRKAVLLSRYANLMKTWAFDERQAIDDDKPIPVPRFSEKGLHLPDYVIIELGRWERQSSPLHVSEEYKELIDGFAKYFSDEAKLIQDPELEQESKLMEKLLK